MKIDTIVTKPLYPPLNGFNLFSETGSENMNARLNCHDEMDALYLDGYFRAAKTLVKYVNLKCDLEIYNGRGTTEFSCLEMKKTRAEAPGRRTEQRRTADYAELRRFLK